jgi:rSAM/selenodomain-associated transferase 2
MRCSVVIPTLNEARTIMRTLRRVERLRPHRIIVSDGGSADSTPELAAPYATVVTGLPGRGRQLNAGAEAASGDVLLFLHADVTLPDDALPAIEDALDDPGVIGGCFRVRFGPAPHQAFISASYDLLRFGGRAVVYGDSTIFVRRAAFEEIGGFADWPIMEDVNFVSRLRMHGRFVELPLSVVPSSRRWRRGGLWRTWASWWAIQLMFGTGVSPAWLGRFYRHIR